MLAFEVCILFSTSRGRPESAHGRLVSPRSAVLLSAETGHPQDRAQVCSQSSVHLQVDSVTSQASFHLQPPSHLSSPQWVLILAQARCLISCLLKGQKDG